MKAPFFIKICGITNIEDAQKAVEAGATAIGLNFYTGSKRYVNPVNARSIADSVRGKIAVVGVFVDEPLASVRSIAASVKLSLCQFHGNESPEYVNTFSNAIKTFRISDSLKNVYFDDYHGSSFLLDSFSDSEYGGTGKTFNWLMAKEANDFGKIIIAGGLNQDNVRDAIEIAQPWGVDVSSGVEIRPGSKDPEKIFKFVHAATSAFQEYL
jgi:phosphoribosylanthranilate isomerase